MTLWPVDGATIRMRADWDGEPDSPRYVQETGRFGAGEQITLRDNELSYIRLNPRTHTPFGLGRLEVAFETIHDFLSAHRYAARTGEQLGGAVRAVDAGIGRGAARAADPLVAGRDRGHRARFRF